MLNIISIGVNIACALIILVIFAKNDDNSFADIALYLVLVAINITFAVSSFVDLLKGL